MKFILSIVALAFLVGALAGSKDNNSASRSAVNTNAGITSHSSQAAFNFMDDVNEKVVRDAEREYQIASASGGSVDRCVQAGMVAAAYLQAHNQPSYQSWKMREEMECHR